MRRPSFRRLAVLAAAAGLVAGIGGIGGSGGASAAPAATGSAVTKTGTAVRTFTDAGKTTTVSTNHVSLSVDQTTGLKSLQQVQVSWSGAKPTQGVAADVNSDYAQNEEYSFDLFECRGVDSTSVPVAQRISPQTCWTQYADERFTSSTDDYPAWRSDSDATAPERAAIAGAPKPVPTECSNILYGTSAQHWLPFVGVDGKTYAGGPQGCAGQPAEANVADYSSLSLPSNETYGVTGADGKGQADFTAFTSEDHASLGCSQTVKCSLVAIPLVGVSCTPAGTGLPADQQPTGDDLADAKSTCENTTGNFTQGQLLSNQQTSGQAALDGSLWWSASNWKNRISVPLSFAPADDVCSLTAHKNPILFYGSELLGQATTSWAPAFCTNPKLFAFQHVQTPEPQARTALEGGTVEAAFGSQPATDVGTAPVVEAPVAVTGFAIAFDIDGTDGQPLSSLKLDPRLLAKLLTESYPDQSYVKSAYPADSTGTETLSANPLNLTKDPEFEALNPGIPNLTGLDAAATLLIVNSDSDVLDALTAYIEADPAASAWLAGAPDPWGMRVNPNYKGISLPSESWPLLDTFEPTAYYQSGANPCLQMDPVPYLPQVASPVSRLFSIAQDMEFAISQPETACTESFNGATVTNVKFSAVGRQTPGHRFMLGLVSLADAERDGLSVASLQTQSTVPATTAFTSAAGQSFAAPTQAGLAAAATFLKQDATTHTFPVPYATMRTDAKGADAYPGTMVVYAQIPTSGLPKTDASQYAQVLDYAAGAGQVPGTEEGNLPAGYLPMSATNGLGGFDAYTKEAATAVAAQQGGIPVPPATAATPPSGAVINPTFGGVGTGDGSAGAGFDGGTGGSGSSGSVGTSSGGATGANGKATTPAGSGSVPTRPLASTRMSVGGASSFLPLLLIAALVAAAGAAGIRLWSRR